MTETLPAGVPACPVCREIVARSDLYERWLAAENFGDTATLRAVAAARGFCSDHARRTLALGSDIAAPIARFVLRTVSAVLERQRNERRGYRDALEPQTLCPWCGSERDALHYAMSDKKHRRGALCPPHARIALVFERRHALHADPPFLRDESLDPPPAREERIPSAVWWSPAVDVLWEMLRASCPACSAAGEASRRREAFLRAGPQPNEHWDVPVLCTAHFVALGAPADAAYRHVPDGIPRSCDWCVPMEQAADRIEELFAIAYRDASFRIAYAAVPGLCIPHATRVARRIAASTLDEFLAATSLRIDAAEWELDERARRRSWQLRDQGSFASVADVAHRAWWLIAGGTRRRGGRDDSRARE